MMVDIPRLFASGFNAGTSRNPLAWMVAHKLWYRSWHQVPAASLPDDDEELCHLAELGFDMKSFKRIKALSMRGWVKCSDGRLYHSVVAGIALESWIEKLHQRISSGAGNAKRWKTSFDPLPIEHEIQRTIDMLRVVNPESRAIVKAQRRASQRNPNGVPPGLPTASRRDSQMHPGAIAKDKDKDKDKDNPVTVPDTLSSTSGAGTTPPAKADGPSDVEIAFSRYCTLRASIVDGARPLDLNLYRKRALAGRLGEIGGLSGWDDILEQIRGSPFLRGETSRGGFVAELDWLLKPVNLTKVREGNYDDNAKRPVANGANSGPSFRTGTTDALRQARVAAGFSGS